MEDDDATGVDTIETEQKRLEEEAEQKRLAEEVEQKRLKEENKTKKYTLNNLIHVINQHYLRRIRLEDFEEELNKINIEDDNLDGIEKFCSMVMLWFKGRVTIRRVRPFADFHNTPYKFKSMDIPEEKRIEIIKDLTELIIKYSKGILTKNETTNKINNLLII